MKEIAIASASRSLVRAKKNVVIMNALTVPRSTCTRIAPASGQRAPSASHTGATSAVPIALRTIDAE